MRRSRAIARHIDTYVAAFHVSHNWTVLGCTAAAAGLLGCGAEELTGMPFDRLHGLPGVQEGIRRAVEDGRLEDDRFTTLQPFNQVMRPIADDVGLCMSWLWLVSPRDLKLTRVLATLRRLPDARYGLMLAALEDPTHRCFTRINAEGRVEDDFGSALSREDLELIDLFMSGRSYGDIGDLLGLSPPMVKRRVHKLAERMGQESPARMREAIWNKHFEELIISRHSAIAGFGDALYRGAECE